MRLKQRKKGDCADCKRVVSERQRSPDGLQSSPCPGGGGFRRADTAQSLILSARLQSISSPKKRRPRRAASQHRSDARSELAVILLVSDEAELRHVRALDYCQHLIDPLISRLGIGLEVQLRLRIHRH